MKIFNEITKLLLFYNIILYPSSIFSHNSILCCYHLSSCLPAISILLTISLTIELSYLKKLTLPEGTDGGSMHFCLGFSTLAITIIEWLMTSGCKTLHRREQTLILTIQYYLYMTWPLVLPRYPYCWLFPQLLNSPNSKVWMTHYTREHRCQYALLFHVYQT